MSKLPKSRNRSLVVQENDKELLIYDLTTNKVFCLNETSAAVYRACEGETTFAELKRKNKFSDKLIYLALDELHKENLLDEEYRSPLAGANRRQIIREIGLSSLLVLPVITSMVAPVAAAAQSTCVNPEGGRPDGQFAGNYSTNGFCGFYPMSTYEEFCDVFASRCCSNEASYDNCTTMPGNPPGTPPFAAVECKCGI